MKCLFELTWSSHNKTIQIDDIVCYRSDIMLDPSCNKSLPNSNGITLHPVSVEKDATSSQPCMLTVEANKMANMVIDAVDIISNARRIEMFSSTGEYMSVSEGTRVDEELECQRPLYMVPCSFQPSLTRCQFQFVSMETPTELWIHSIHLTISRRADVSPHSLLHSFGGLGGLKIDMNKVKSIMSDMNVQELHPQAKELMDRIATKQQELEAVAGSARQEMPSPFASAMMSMFANMVVDTSSTSTVVTGTRSTERRSCEEPRNGPDNDASISTVQTVQRPLIVPADTNISVASEVDPTVYAMSQHSVASDSLSGTKSTLPHCTACGCAMSAGLEQRLVQLIGATEQRLMSRFTLEIGRVETKINSRFDEILRRLSGDVRAEAVSLFPCDLD